MGLITLAPNITTVYGKRLPSKARAVEVKRAQQATIAMQLLDGSGNPMDLTQFGFIESSDIPEFTIFARFIEAIERTSPIVDSIGTVVDAAEGQVTFDVPELVVANAGVYRCEIGAFDNSSLILSNSLYIWVDRGLFLVPQNLLPTPPLLAGCPQVIKGPPTLDEIRVSLRDAPEANRLTDQYEFDIADICEATVRAVQYWNSAPPQMLHHQYCTLDFPFRNELRDGIAAFLFEFAATYYRRVTLPYQGGGVAVDDLAKEQPYLQVSQLLRQRYETFVRRAKVQMNMNDGFGELGSFYSWWGWLDNPSLCRRSIFPFMKFFGL